MCVGIRYHSASLAKELRVLALIYPKIDLVWLTGWTIRVNLSRVRFLYHLKLEPPT